MKKAISALEVAEILDVDISWVYRHKDELKARSLPGRLIRFDRDYILSLVSVSLPRSLTTKKERPRLGHRKEDLWL